MCLNRLKSDFLSINVACQWEDYRGAVVIELQHEDDEGQKLQQVLWLWGKHGAIKNCFDPLALWREHAEQVSGHALAVGHFLAKEIPQQVMAVWQAFFCQHRDVFE